MTVNQATVDLVKRWADVGGHDECWVFNKKNKVKNGTGKLEYGQVTYLKRKWRAHRLVASLALGPIPDGQQVCHKCDNPLCLNPSHLFFGSNAENVADKMIKGRHRALKGQDNGAAKLKDEQVREIISLKGRGMTQGDVAAIFGVSRPLISLIWSGRHRKCA
jgi:hypothetical protein